MRITTTNVSLAEIAADAIVLPVFQNESPASKTSAVLAEADAATDGLLSRLIEQKEITGKPYELVTLLAPPGMKTGQLLIIGLGERAKLDEGMLYRAAAAASKHLAGKPRGGVAFAFGSELSAEQIEAAVAGAIVGCHGQDLYRAEKKRTPFAEIVWHVASKGESLSAAEKRIASGTILGESINLTRRLVNEPAQDLYPESFADHAAAAAREYGLEIEVWDEAKLNAERCGSLLAVARGSSRPPRLVQLHYRGGKPGAPTLALVGKGVTFDSGGLSLKPTDGMLTMKCDMAGAATVLGAILAIARLKLPCNVTAYAGLVENMTGPAAFKLGDVLHARNGKTIEVHNTDAEGRLVLADVLDVAVESGAAKIIDLATLTGACVVALGRDVVGALSNNQPWCDQVLTAASHCGEGIWQLPMFAEYDEHIKSEIADIKNVGDGRWAGAISAAKFLEQFVKQTPWVHLDIAGPAFADKPKPWIDGGGTGVMLRTLVEVARKWN
ncbi:MAG: leucyl aminopeptidase [Planctomycetota bacterium]|nr:leucyl aminopeptidase [Planctomycetota bacterium]